MAKRVQRHQRKKKVRVSSDDKVLDRARRTMLKRLGLFAAFTAPAILAMSWSDKAAAVVVDSSDTL